MLFKNSAKITMMKLKMTSSRISK